MLQMKEFVILMNLIKYALPYNHVHKYLMKIYVINCPNFVHGLLSQINVNNKLARILSYKNNVSIFSNS